MKSLRGTRPLPFVSRCFRSWVMIPTDAIISIYGFGEDNLGDKNLGGHRTACREKLVGKSTSHLYLLGVAQREGEGHAAAGPFEEKGRSIVVTGSGCSRGSRMPCTH